MDGQMNTIAEQLLDGPGNLRELAEAKATFSITATLHMEDGMEYFFSDGSGLFIGEDGSIRVYQPREYLEGTKLVMKFNNGEEYHLHNRNFNRAHVEVSKFKDMNGGLKSAVWRRSATSRPIKLI
jgi:hypothetical protein